MFVNKKVYMSRNILYFSAWFAPWKGPVCYVENHCSERKTQKKTAPKGGLMGVITASADGP